ncbi:FAD-binding protein [Trebonia kvetii]|uniref:FAD-binding protein n=1 Tax=Trebonia kvetii TaxID=2480626 RepID=A0A6P2BQV4_9ACTN|nr:FAD-binding protein [Trebonia kvetii]
MPVHWDIEADIVVVGFGAAGACAALEAAAAGRSVVVLDRFTGGGATALSGGVVYAGGGTPQQRAAGVTDNAAAMFGYLRTEVGDVVPPETLRRFCDDSVSMLGWLESHGVPFEGSLCPDKTSYPTNRHYLYYSGSEMSARDLAPPAPRGHRTRGRGTSGRLLFARLAAATRRAGVQVVGQSAAVRLVTDGGQVTGVACRTLRGAPWWTRTAHRLLHRVARKPYLYVPKAGRLMHKPVTWLERRYGRALLVGAVRGVVIAAGGFGANRELLRAHASSARGGLPLATPGDDGSGLLLGTGAGGVAALLDRVSVWRFLSPPPALLRGILVDTDGQRICDESRYGAAIGDEIVRRGGRAWLFADRATITAARRQLRGSTLWFQRLQARYLLTFGRVTADTVTGVAARAGVDPDGLAATVAAYNTDAASPGGESAESAGKPADLVVSQDQPPYSLIDYSIRPRLLNPAPVLTLGGLVVDHATGQVLRADGTAVPGLYAAGRSAVGLCSRSYVSGLSIADCVFSGRRAGRHASAASHVTPADSDRENHQRDCKNNGVTSETEETPDDERD